MQKCKWFCLAVFFSVFFPAVTAYTELPPAELSRLQVVETKVDELRKNQERILEKLESLSERLEQLKIQIRRS